MTQLNLSDIPHPDELPIKTRRIKIPCIHTGIHKKNASATKKGPGRYHKDGYKK